MQQICCHEGCNSQSQASTSFNLSSELVLFSQVRPWPRKESLPAGLENGQQAFKCFWKESGYIYSKEFFSAQAVQQLRDGVFTSAFPSFFSVIPRIQISTSSQPFSCPFLILFSCSKVLFFFFFFLKQLFPSQDLEQFGFENVVISSLPVIRLGQLVSMSTLVCGCCDLPQLFCFKRKNNNKRTGRKPQ